MTNPILELVTRVNLDLWSVRDDAGEHAVRFVTAQGVEFKIPCAVSDNPQAEMIDGHQVLNAAKTAVFAAFDWLPLVGRDPGEGDRVYVPADGYPDGELFMLGAATAGSDGRYDCSLYKPSQAFD